MSIKILLADDSITIQKVVGIIFGGEDYALTVVDNGKSAVEKARETDPDVMLIDALMPGMSGYEVCEAVRSTAALATKPILLLTGSFEPFDENKAKSCGADDFIAKPFESQQIVTKVKELFELGKNRSSAAAVPSVTPAIAPQATAVTQFEPAGIAAPVPPVQTIQPPAVTPAQELASPFETTASPFETTTFVPEPVTTAAPAIWDAFTPSEPVAPASLAPTEVHRPVMTFPNDDVFAMVQEEPEIVPVQPATAPSAEPQHIASQWVPVEEQTFEFAEEKVAEVPPAVFDTPATVVESASFGDICFEEPVQPAAVLTPAFEELTPAPFDKPLAAAPEFAAFDDSSPFETSYQEPVNRLDTAALATPQLETPPPLASATAAPPAMPFVETETFEPIIENTTPSASVVPEAMTSAAMPLSLTEEQIKAALSSVSKDVIERIVWEVVPDLAEILIKEAIRKIKDGI